MVEPEHQEISVRRQCQLLGLGRSSLYYCSQAPAPYNEQLMRLLDEARHAELVIVQWNCPHFVHQALQRLSK